MTTKIVYLFDQFNGQFIGEYEAHESPLEEGVFIAPIYSTDINPPSFKIDEIAIFSTSSNSWYVLKKEEEKLPEPSDDELLKKLEVEIRSSRNEKLDAVDKKINKLEDNGLDATAFRKYRQALRDVPEQTGFPNNVTWPSEPI